MRRFEIWAVSLCLGVAVASFVVAACHRTPKVVVYDLADRMAVAERSSSRDVLLFGTPAAEPHQAEGFYREAAAQADRFLWSKGESELSLQWPQPQPRAAVLEMAPYSGVKDQAVEVRLNGSEVARFALNDTRHRYRVELPPQAQRSGDNRLRFSFAHTASPAAAGGNADRRQLAAAFYALTVAPRTDEGLEDLLRRDAPPPFATIEKGGLPALVQVGPSSLRYALALPADAELRFTPEMHPSARAAAASALLRVTVEREGQAEREVWHGQVGGESVPQEVIVPLPGKAGDVVRLGLHVAGAGRSASRGFCGARRASWGGRRRGSPSPARRRPYRTRSRMRSAPPRCASSSAG